jgi:outer membrane lipoprotein LolB
MGATRVAPRAIVAFCATAIVLLSGCRTAPLRVIVGPGADAPWSEQHAALEKLERYGLNGRVAVVANGDGFSASLRYAQQGRGANLSLDGPLGLGGLRVEFDDRDIEINTSRGERLDGPLARAELERRLGFELPLAQLRWWLLGIPAPGDAAVDSEAGGAIRGFTQQGWRVSIESRAAGLGFALPRRLTAERDGARIKLLVERWY